MQQYSFEAGLVAGESGISLDEAQRLVQDWLPRVGEPIERQIAAAERAAAISEILRRKAENLAEAGEIPFSEKAWRFASAFRKISHLAQREVEIMREAMKMK